MTAKSKTIGVGIIGLGMGVNALRINADLNSALQVRAICDVNTDSIARVADQFPEENLFTTTEYREILDRSDIDVVGIYSPDHLHITHLTDALSAGKHVMCTKPMVISLDEAKATVNLVRRTGQKFLVGQTCRFVPRFMAAKELLDSGDLGKLLFVESHYVHDMRPVFDSTPWRYEAPQDFMYGGACHPIDLLRWVAGDVDEVFCYASESGMDTRYPNGKMDNFLINLKFKNGVIGRIMAVFGLVEPPLPMNGLSVYGTGGTYVEDTVVLDKFVGMPEWSLDFKHEGGHGNEVLRYMRHLEECLIDDKKPLVDEIEGAKCIATCDAAWESVATGQPIKVFNDF